MNSDELEQFLAGFIDENGEPFEVTPDGSLGLLALGDLGLAAWRLVRARAAAESTEQPEEQQLQ